MQTRNENVVQGEAVVLDEEQAAAVPNEDEQAVDDDKNTKDGGVGIWFQRQPRWIWIVLAIAVVAIVVGVVMGVVVSQNGSNSGEESSTAEPTLPLTPAPSVQVVSTESPTTPSKPNPTTIPPTPLSVDATVQLLQANSFHGGMALNDPTSPQSKALQWLSRSTSLVDYSDSRKLQRFALATLYYSTGGEGWRNSSSWLTNAHECDWYISNQFYGPMCNDGETVSTLFLQQENLVGPMPPDLALLSDSLTTLSLEWNFLSGPFPSEMGLLTRLRFLDLGPNELTSSIPSEIAGMTSLAWLSFGVNLLTGTVPTEINQMARLDYLNIQDNNLSPPFSCPSFISQCFVSCEDEADSSCREL